VQAGIVGVADRATVARPSSAPRRMTTITADRAVVAARNFGK